MQMHISGDPVSNAARRAVINGATTRQLVGLGWYGAEELTPPSDAGTYKDASTGKIMVKDASGDTRFATTTEIAMFYAKQPLVLGALAIGGYLLWKGLKRR